MIEPRSQTQIGSHLIYGAISTEIEVKELPKIQDVNPNDLMVHLISLGYVDNEGYLTSNFNPLKKLRLHSNYTLFEEQISKVLAKSYIEMITRIEVESSLNLDQSGKHLSLSTLLPNSVSVTIQIKSQQNDSALTRFMSRVYPAVHSTITKDKTQINLEGLLIDINSALSQIVIDLTHTDSCEGKIIVNDGYNRQINKHILDISQYFEINNAPVMDSNLHIQDQINNVSIFTGEHFQIDFATNTFTDSNNDVLSYDIVSGDNEEIPSWLVFRDFSLKGTPPEVISPSEFSLIFIARDEYKKLEVPFKLKVRLSFSFITKLVIQYGSYLISIFGFLFFANKISMSLERNFTDTKKTFLCKLDKM